MASASATPAEHCRLLKAAVAYAKQIVLRVGKDLWNIIGGKEESLKEDRTEGYLIIPWTEACLMKG